MKVLYYRCMTTECKIYTVPTMTSDRIYQLPFGSEYSRDIIKDMCFDKLPVPNIVHYVQCKNQTTGFFQFLSYLSAAKIIKPCVILFHGDALPFGKYWNVFKSIYPRIVHIYRKCPSKINSTSIKWTEHSADIMRIEALMEFGGIYSDWDVFWLRSPEHLRHYKYTQGYEESNRLSNAVIIGSSNATFLKLWHKGYELGYKAHHWTYNSLLVPTTIATETPSLIHIEGYNFIRPKDKTLEIEWSEKYKLFSQNYDWSDNYAIHPFIRFYKYKTQTDEIVIRTLNTTVGSVARHILFGNKELCL